jgi:hypothetical protein
MSARPSFRNAQLRRALEAKGLTPLPRCPLCGEQQQIQAFTAHTTQCERDCASQVIFACDLRLAAIHSTEPRNPELATLIEVEADWLSAERFDAHNVIFGFDSQGRGTMHTGHPGYPLDGLPF